MEEKRARQEVAVEACVDKSEGCRGWADAGEVRLAGCLQPGRMAGLGYRRAATPPFAD